jgi:capsule biosynthesis phosphatase
MKNKVPRLVFDVDDTICKNGRVNGYLYAEPMPKVIEKINHLHDDLGYEIVLFTARGAISCEGNLDRIKEKNEQILIEWLRRNDVHYDELFFGKPLGDLYIDDKGISLSQFMNESFGELKGGSGQRVIRLGNIVKKDMKNHEEVEMLEDWMEANANLLNAPRIISAVYDSVYMEYIGGQLLCDCLDELTLIDLIYTIYGFSLKKYPSFDLTKHLNSLAKHKGFHAEIDKEIDECIKALMKHEKSITNKASFSHGDMTLCNIIKEDNSERLCFIDPQFKPNASSYLLDFAKLRMSLDGYEYEFGISSKNNRSMKVILDEFLESKKLLDEVVILEVMWILRLTRYKDDKDKVANFARRVMAEHEELFRTK